MPRSVGRAFLPNLPLGAASHLSIGASWIGKENQSSSACYECKWELRPCEPACCLSRASPHFIMWLSEGVTPLLRNLPWPPTSGLDSFCFVLAYTYLCHMPFRNPRQLLPPTQHQIEHEPLCLFAGFPHFLLLSWRRQEDSVPQVGQGLFLLCSARV